MKYYNLVIFFAITIVSCKSIDKNELKTINDIQLGISLKEYSSLLETLNIKQKSFLTGIHFPNYDLNSHSKSFHYTTNFDFSNYKGKNTSHLGLLYPEVIAGTENIMGLFVLLVHTDNPRFILHRYSEPQNIGGKYTSISQHVAIDVLDEIEDMYTRKYGKPIDTITESIFITYKEISSTEIKSYRPPDIEGVYQELIWETKYLRISFFKGMFVNQEKFDTETNRYAYNIGLDLEGKPEVQEIKVDYKNGETFCNSYPFIKYELKQDAIDKLKLDNIKI